MPMPQEEFQFIPLPELYDVEKDGEVAGMSEVITYDLHVLTMMRRRTASTHQGSQTRISSNKPDHHRPMDPFHGLSDCSS
jgi:hypothetical protein